MPADADQPPPEMRCLKCGYNLRGLPENRCPECGRPFDPDDRQTWDPRELTGAAYRDAAVVGAVLVLASPVIGFLFNKYAAEAISEWVSTVALLAAGLGLAVEITVLYAVARRMLNITQPPEDMRAYGTASLISLCVILIVLLALFVIPSIR